MNCQCRHSHHTTENIPPTTHYTSIAGTRPMTEIVLSQTLCTSFLHFAEHCMKSHVKCLVPTEGRAGKNNWIINVHFRKPIWKFKKWVTDISLDGGFHSWVKLLTLPLTAIHPHSIASGCAGRGENPARQAQAARGLARRHCNSQPQKGL